MFTSCLLKSHKEGLDHNLVWKYCAYKVTHLLGLRWKPWHRAKVLKHPPTQTV